MAYTLITDISNIDSLITPLRMHINDSTFTISDSELRTRLLYATKALAARWNNKYLVNTSNDVERNPNLVYLFSSPPVIQNLDERAIILQASIDVKGSLFYNSAWNVGSWKDEEISYSNVTGAKSVQDSLLRDIEELNNILPVGRQRLAQPSKQSLPGFNNPPNEYEG